MAFNAGDVEITLKLDKTEFNKDLGNVKKSLTALSKQIAKDLTLQIKTDKSLDAVKEVNTELTKTRDLLKEIKGLKLGKFGAYTENSSTGETPTDGVGGLEDNTKQTSIHAKNASNSFGKIAASTAQSLVVYKSLKSIEQVISKSVQIQVKSYQLIFKSLQGIVNLSKQLTNYILKNDIAIKGITTAFKEIKSSVTDVFSFSNIKSFVKDSLEAGSALTEVQNVIDQTFRDGADAVSEWAKTTQTQYGLTELQAKKYLGTFGAMVKSFGVDTSQIKEISESLTGLSADIASFFNIDYESAFTKIRSGLAGQVRPLQELGISLNVANLQAFALSKGITESWKSMTSAEKTLLRYNYLLNVTRDLQGDFARTSYTWANQVRLLQNAWSAFSSTMGQALINIFNPLLQVLNLLMAKLIQVAQVFNSFTEKVFGKSFVGNSTAKDSVSSYFEAAEESAENASNAVNRFTTSFDELHKANSDSSSGSDSTGGIGGLDLSTLNQEIPSPEQSPLAKWFDGLLNKFDEGWNKIKVDLSGAGKYLSGGINSLLAKLNDSWPDIKDFFTKIVTGVATFANGFIQELDAETVGTSIREYFQTIYETIDTFITEFEWYKNAINLGNIINEMFSPDDSGNTSIDTWRQMIVDSINGFISFIKGFVDTINFADIGSELGENIRRIFTDINVDDLTTTIKDFGTKLGTILCNLLTELFTVNEDGSSMLGNIGTILGSFVQGILNFLANSFTDANVDNIINSVGTMVSNFFEQIDGDSLELVAKNVAKLIQGVKEAVEKNIDKDKVFSFIKGLLEGIDLGELVEDILDGIIIILDAVIALVLLTIGSLLKKILDVFINFIVTAEAYILIKVYNFVSGLINAIIGFVKTFVQLVITIISELIKNIIGFVTTLGQLIWLGITTLGTKIKDCVTSFVTWISDKFKQIGEGLKNSFKSAINWVIDKLNFVIKLLNKFKINIPDDVPIVGGAKFGGFNLDEIPKLANGGYVAANSPQLAMIGDNKKEGEIVAPESKITEAVHEGNKELITAIYTLIGMLQAGGNTQQINRIDIDGDIIDKLAQAIETRNLRG